jgi:hypothetical protein
MHDDSVIPVKSQESILRELKETVNWNKLMDRAMMDEFDRIIVAFGLTKNLEAQAILYYFREWHRPNEESNRILIGMLRLRFGSPWNIEEIMREFCPNDPELDPYYQDETEKFITYLKTCGGQVNGFRSIR